MEVSPDPDHPHVAITNHRRQLWVLTVATRELVLVDTAAVAKGRLPSTRSALTVS